jgi:hypothetical protein
MVAIYAPGISYVGAPETAPWDKIADCNIWCAHNSPFDRAVYTRLQELGKVPSKISPTVWVNTADLAAYMKCKRNLAIASELLLGKKVDKSIRNRDMKGAVYADIPDNQKEAWKKYALDDAMRADELWVKFKDSWPRQEQLLSLHTSECVRRGIKVDAPYVDQCLEHLTYAVDYACRQIPWYGEEEKTKTGKTRMKAGNPVIISPTSTTKLARYARDMGIPLPSTTEVKSKEFQDWEKQYGEQFPVIRAMQTWRKCNRLLKIFQQIRGRIRPDGRMEFQLCYFGAHTGRWSGKPGGGDDRNEDETGLNMQNLPRDSVYLDEKFSVCSKDKAAHTIDTRGVFVGEKLLGVVDLSQIEPRVLANIVGDAPFVRRCKAGESPYEVHARTSMGYDDPEPLKKKEPMVYALAKARVLALGYSAGWFKFIEMASTYVSEKEFNTIFTAPTDSISRDDFLRYLKKYGKDYVSTFQTGSEELKNIWTNSWLQVVDFRQKNPRIVAFWNKCQALFEADAKEINRDHHIELPSGRTLTYYSPSRDGMATTMRGGSRKYFYGGKLVENIVQAIARDVHGLGIINLELAGYPVICHVHDEVITEIEREDQINDIIKIISRAPEWLPHLPVAAEGHAMERYAK